MKICTKCKVEQPDENFALRHDRKPGSLVSSCRTCGRVASADWKRRNPERTRELSRKSAAAFFVKHPERVRANARRSVYHRLKTSPSYKILHNLRRRLNKAIHGECHSIVTLDLLGCSMDHLRVWLTFYFQPGMSWSNYGRGGWVVDHIRPCISFDLTDSAQQKICFHYTNLQPLWEKDNLRKGAKIVS